jgi:MFS transporter, PPP family, 3-phenylpropionic acid transporter
MPNPTWISGALYFGYYMALGSYMPYITLYYERMGLSGVQIGVLSALPVLVGASTVLIWGTIADARHWHNRILHLTILLAAASILMLSTGSTFQELVPFIIAFAFFNSPIVPLLDSSAVEIASLRQSAFGNIRVWGSIGWSISTLLVGMIIQKFNIKWLFYCYVAVMLLTFAVSFLLPKRTVVLRTSLAHGMKKLVTDVPFLVFLFSVFLVSITMGATNAFFSIYMDSIGSGESAIGLAWTISALSEIPILLYSSALLRKIGSTGLLKIAFITYGVRWLLYSFINTPFLVIILQALHGLCFATYLIGSVTYINAHAPEGMTTSALSLLNFVSFGAGAIIGSLLAGYIYQSAGLPWLFRLLSLLAFAGLGIFMLSQPRQVKVATL